MKKAITTGLIVIGLFLLLFGGAYLVFVNIDFVGKKDPKTVEANVKREKSKLLSAEFRDGTDYCEINLMNKQTIEISTGNNATGIVIFERYHVSGDTIIIEKDPNKFADEDLREYINTYKFLIAGNQIFFELNADKQYNKSKAMVIKFNKLEKQIGAEIAPIRALPSGLPSSE